MSNTEQIRKYTKKYSACLQKGFSHQDLLEATTQRETIICSSAVTGIGIAKDDLLLHWHLLTNERARRHTFIAQ